MHQTPVRALVMLALLCGACSRASPPATDGAERTQSSASAPVELSQRPLVFFGPLPHPKGSRDFMDLFDPQAPWAEAASHVQIFKLYGGWVAHFPWEGVEATDEELAMIVGDLNRRGIAIGFEAGPLVPSGQCGMGVEGFFGPEEGLQIVRRLKQLGADVKYVTFDEPFAFAHIYDGPQACHWPTEKIALQVQDYVETLREYYPEAVYGDIEPLWAGVPPEKIISWLDTYEEVTGSRLPFIHLDLDFSRPDWPSAAKQIEDAARARGIDFGIFYIGDNADATDGDWITKALDRARIYELIAGGRPDHVIFQSWHDHPDAVLPETEAETFTGLINLYFRERPVLTLVADETGRASGTLFGADGTSLADAQIELSATALSGPGLLGEYSISGTVPAGAVQSDVGFRVNMECGCQGNGQFILHKVLYTEGGDTANLVPNGDFSAGLSGWAAWGSGSVWLESTGEGRALQVQAGPAQDAAINSAPFNVTPGANYTLTFVAQIPPSAAGSGYFDITFQDSQAEFARQKILLGPARISMGKAVTDPNGAYTMDLVQTPASEIMVEANYAGNAVYWPAYAQIIMTTR